MGIMACILSVNICVTMFVFIYGVGQIFIRSDNDDKRLHVNHVFQFSMIKLCNFFTLFIYFYYGLVKRYNSTTVISQEKE